MADCAEECKDLTYIDGCAVCSNTKCTEPKTLCDNGNCVCPSGTPTGANENTCLCDIENCLQNAVNDDNECICQQCDENYVLSKNGKKCCPELDYCSSYGDNCECLQCADTSGDCLSFTVVGNVCVCTKCSETGCAKFCSPQIANCITTKIENDSCICEECSGDLVPSEDGKSCIVGCAAGLTAYEGSYYPAMYNSTTPTRYAEISFNAALPSKVSGTHCCSNNPSASGQYEICCPAGSVMEIYYQSSFDTYAYSCGSQAFCDAAYGDNVRKWEKGLSGGDGWEKACYPLNYQQYSCGAMDGWGAAFVGLGYWLDPKDGSADELCSD